MAKEDALARKHEDALVDQSRDGDSENFVKVTTYIREDQALALELIENAERESRGGSFDQAELFQEALDMLIKERIIAIKLPSKQIAKKSG